MAKPFKVYRVMWKPGRAEGFGEPRRVGDYEAANKAGALRAARSENRASHGDSRGMVSYRKSMFVQGAGKPVKPTPFLQGGGWGRLGTPNPSKSLTLRNMALVTIKRLPGGALKVSGRRMKGR